MARIMDVFLTLSLVASIVGLGWTLSATDPKPIPVKD